nr:uncharacterized protein CI109_006230 [Kwoniella shandongensis]KAA5525426.1 hypothetical protein CI109_006230 [Kwoniella shandongensis]
MSANTDADRLPTPEELEEAYKAEIFDEDGAKTTFGELVREGNNGRVLVVFIRHFWCWSCQIYTHHLSKSIPPSSLPDGTSIVIIGCGSSASIKPSIQRTSTPYKIYANPSLSLHKTFDFVVSMKGTPENQKKKEYIADVGNFWKRVWRSLSGDVLNNPRHASESIIGPGGQNGGELIFEKDGTCLFMHRMQHTEDHTDIKDIAEKLGAEYVPLTEDEQKWKP